MKKRNNKISFWERISDAISEFFSTSNDNDEHILAIEDVTRKSILGLLQHSGTSIDCDTIREKYVLDNKRLHLTIHIFGSNKIIRMTNTKLSNGSRYRNTFIKEMVTKILTENSDRLNAIDESVENRIETIATSMLTTIEKDLSKT